MKNTKLMAILIAVASVSVMSAGWYDIHGNYHHGRGPVRHAVRTTENTVKAAGTGVLDAVTLGRYSDQPEDADARKKAARDLEDKKRSANRKYADKQEDIQRKKEDRRRY